MALSHADVVALRSDRTVNLGAGTATVSVLFTDLVDSTAILNHDGADRSDTIRRTHFGALRQAIHRCRGEEIKTTGDGLMVVFRSALDAVECAVAIQRAVARLRREEPCSPEVRVGLSAGEATVENDDWYGQPVVEAARLCATAEHGQILLTEVVAALIRTWTKHHIVSVGSRSLKGFDEPVFVREVEWADGDVVPLPLPPAVSPVARETLVGREAEAGRLALAWERAKAGERRLVLIGGEPGIGKTCLTAELARKVHDEGGTVLWGRSDEDLEVGYQSFVEALEHFFAHFPTDEIIEQLGCRAHDLARLVPDIGGEPAPTSAVDPNGDRLRLFEAVSLLLTTASRTAPVLLVLDDLHWAPRSALKLLRHLARDPRDAALLVVGTYRHTDLGTSHPLTELLADLHRERHVDRVELSGLHSTDVATFLEVASGGRQLDERGLEFATVLQHETAGNPFFVGQLLHHLTEIEAVSPRDGRWRPELPLGEYGMPDSLREVIARRLSRLSEAANRALKVAAVIGHEFDLRTLELAPAAAEDPMALLDVLEESCAARLIVELDGPPGRFGFNHTLVRQALLDALSATRRARLHRQIGEAIEAQPGAADLVGRLAYHYCAGAPAGSATRGVLFAEQAALEALEKLASEAAIVHLERGLKAFALTEQPDPATRARLLVMLAEALHLAGDVTRSKSVAAQGADEARFAACAKLVAKAALWRAALPQAGVEDPLAGQLLDEALGAVADSDVRLRAALLGQLALYRAMNEGHGPAADPIARQAVDTARLTGDTTAVARALMDRCVVLQGSHDVRSQRVHIEELAALLPLLPVRNRAAAEKVLLRHDAVVHLQTGEVARFDDDVEAFSRLCSGSGLSGEWLDLATLAMWRTLRAMLDGRFGDAEVFAAEMLHRAPDEINFHNTYAAQLFLLRRDQGRLAEIKDVLREAVQTAPRLVGFRAALALTQAELGAVDEAREELEALAIDDGARVPYVTRASSLALLVETGAEVGDAEHSARAYEVLLPHSGQLLVVGWGAACLGAADRFLGVAAANTRRWDDAERHFEAAVALEEAAGSAPLLARTQFSYARALAARGRRLDRTRALDMLDAAAVAADELDLDGLQLGLGALRDRLR
jgi:class 3 adenylate cyclase